MKYIPWNEFPSAVPLIETHFNQLSHCSSEMRFFSRKNPDMIRDWLTSLTRQNLYEHHWIAKMSDAGEIICLGQISAYAKIAEIAVSVLDNHQGKGIGREMIAKLIEKCNELGHKKIFVCCLPSNRIVISILRDLGFDLAYDNFSNEFCGYLELV